MEYCIPVLQHFALQQQDGQDLNESPHAAPLGLYNIKEAASPNKIGSSIYRLDQIRYFYNEIIDFSAAGDLLADGV